MVLAYGEPFSTQLLALLDLLRIATVAGGLLVVGAMVAEWNRGTVTRGRRIRHFGVGLVVLTVAGSRVPNLGERPTWQLFAGVVGIAALVWVTFWHHQVDEGV